MLRPTAVDVGLLRAAIWPEGPDGIKTALLFSLQSDPALPLGLAAYPLIAHARKLLTSASGVEEAAGTAPRRRRSSSKMFTVSSAQVQPEPKTNAVVEASTQS